MIKNDDFLFENYNLHKANLNIVYTFNILKQAIRKKDRC